MPNKLDQAREQLARANRMIAHEGVLDAFGHVTLRHQTDAGRYLMSVSRAPELVSGFASTMSCGVSPWCAPEEVV